MAAFLKFNKFSQGLAQKLFDLESDVIKCALTNTAPTAATDTDFDPGGDHPPPAAANGYTAGGHTMTEAGSAETGGVYTFATTTDVVITATAGGIGPFRYVLLYDDTSTDDKLIGYWDYGSSISLNDGETFTIDVTTSFLTITTT